MKPISILIREFLRLPSIAVVGISSNKQTVANGVFQKLQNGKRSIYAVGRNSTSFNGVHCYPDLVSLPAAPHGIFISARPKNIERAIDECIAQNIQRVWIHSMGGTTSSSVVSPSVVQKCADHVITLIPGACPMMFVDDADISHRCIKWFLTATGQLK
jgi:predicted CoA-binding protein